MLIGAYHICKYLVVDNYVYASIHIIKCSSSLFILELMLICGVYNVIYYTCLIYIFELHFLTDFLMVTQKINCYYSMNEMGRLLIHLLCQVGL